ncbi:MAG: DNA polymerase/3'-5' exonuclease PolX [Rhodocyclaceae bacterium]|nr:DNA polymerase/3'-5' exonuclease PolX [Rhodocyclaceae bacterium]
MPIHNADIAAIFTEIADLLEIEGANPFRIRAYRNAARLVGDWPHEMATLIARGEDLTRLPGIGVDLAAKIREIVETGRCRALEKLRGELPPAITELLHIPGLGPKRVRTLWHDLDIETPEQLARAARDHRIRELPGFGPKIEANILQAVERHVSENRRLMLATAAQYAASLLAWMRAEPAVEKIEIAGSFRRARETVGDLDLLVATRDADAAMRRFVAYEEVGEVLAAGSTRASLLLKSGLQVDLRVIDPTSWGAALCYFTGSKAHNIALRKIAQETGLKLNEYGLFRGRQKIAGESEEGLYAALGLDWIPPELREDRGEIGAARAHRLPRLVTLADLRGDLHVHTKASDGHDTLEAMAAEAQTLGFEYLAITEHSKRLALTHGLDARRLLEQCERIDRLNESFRGFRLLKGIEVDILEDGSLDLPDDVLAHLDLVVGAIHSRFDLSRAKQTERILRAFERPYFTLLAHPTGRLLEERPPYDVDLARIVRAAKARGCFLELNAHPARLDLTDTDCLMAKDEGVLVAIDSDAHSRADFANLRYGVGQARRGWLEAQDVLNTRSLAELLPLLARSRR